jgi:hypothetical protein
MQLFLETRRDAPNFGSRLKSAMDLFRILSHDKRSTFRYEFAQLLLSPVHRVESEQYSPLLYDLFIQELKSAKKATSFKGIHFFKFQEDLARLCSDFITVENSFFIRRIHMCFGENQLQLIPDELQREYLIQFILIVLYSSNSNSANLLLYNKSNNSTDNNRRIFNLQKKIIEALINSFREAESTDIELKRELDTKIQELINSEVLPAKMFEDELKESHNFFLSSLGIASSIYEKVQNSLENKSESQLERYVVFFQSKLESNVAIDMYHESKKELWQEIAITFRRNIENYPQVPGKKLVVDLIRRTRSDTMNPLLLFFYYYIRSDEQKNSLSKFCKEYRVPYEEFFYSVLGIYVQIYNSGHDLSTETGTDHVLDFIEKQDEMLDTIDLDICLSICSSHRLAKAILLSKKNMKHKAIQELMKNIEHKLRNLRICLNEEGSNILFPEVLDLNNLDVISDEPHVVNPNQFIEDQTINTNIDFEFYIPQVNSNKLVDVLDYAPVQDLFRNVRYGLRICKEASDQSQLNEQQLQAMWLPLLERFLREQNMIRATSESTSSQQTHKSSIPSPVSTTTTTTSSNSNAQKKNTNNSVVTKKEMSIDELFGSGSGMDGDDDNDENMDSDEDEESENVILKKIEKLQQLILETQNEIADFHKELATSNNLDKQKRAELEHRKLQKQNFLKRKYEEKENEERKMKETQENSKKLKEEMNICDSAKYWLLRCIGYIIRIILNEMIKVIPVPVILESYSNINGSIQFGPLRKIVMRILDLYRYKHTLLEKQSALLQNDTLIEGNRYYYERTSAALPKNIFDVCYAKNCEYQGVRQYDVPVRFFRCGHSFHIDCNGGKISKCSACHNINNGGVDMNNQQQQDNIEEESDNTIDTKLEQQSVVLKRYEQYERIDKLFNKRTNLETLNQVIDNANAKYRLITSNIRGDNTTSSEHSLLLHPIPVRSSKEVSNRLWNTTHSHTTTKPVNNNSSNSNSSRRLLSDTHIDRYKILTEHPVVSIESIPILSFKELENRILGINSSDSNNNNGETELSNTFFWLDN